MRVVVVGAGAWGLPAAAELARRGHQVDLLDGYGVGNAMASSGGASRIWRLSHGDRHGVRLGLRAVEAWHRLEERADAEILLRRGLLWRGPDAGLIAEALASEGVAAVWVQPDDVAAFVPTLRSNGVPAVWQDQAGPVLVPRAQQAQLGVLERHGGRVSTGRWVERVDVRPDGVHAALRDGGSFEADVAVLAPGPWAAQLLASVGLNLDLHPVLEQVGYFLGQDGTTDWTGWPCVVDTEPDSFGVYGMATPGLGYKLGWDSPLRDLAVGDDDREPSPQVVAHLERWAAENLPGLAPTVVSSQVCSWTDSADGWFVVDRLHGGQVVVACGDSGQGFKFSALMGEMLADLAEGATPDADLAALSAARFTSEGAS